MEILPSIDLREGECATILGSDSSTQSLRSRDAVEQAVILREQGAEWVHVTDWDGAFSGHLCNLRVLQEIIEMSGLHMQHNGGVRSMEHIDTLISLGVERVVVGNSIMHDRELLLKAYKKYGEKIIPGVDGLDGMVAIEGFETAAATSVIILLRELKEMGFRRVLYTDRRRCGVMKGPNFEGIKEIIAIGGMRVMVAGGINSYDAIYKLKDMGAGSLVIGRAIYTGVINLSRAREIAKQLSPMS